MANDNRNRESARNSGRSGRDDESLQNPGARSRAGEVEPGQTEAGGSRRGEAEIGERGRSGQGASGASRRGSNPGSGEEENENIEQPGEE